MRNKKKTKLDWKVVEILIQEITALQKRNMLSCAKRIVTQVTADDLLQPNDFPELENDPLFRYEEGVMAGIQTLEMALRSALNQAE